MLPQLRNITAMELGCDSRGYSRAGNDTKIWYCAIVAGRLSQELNKMRKVSFFHLLLIMTFFNKIKIHPKRLHNLTASVR